VLDLPDRDRHCPLLPPCPKSHTALIEGSSSEHDRDRDVRALQASGPVNSLVLIRYLVRELGVPKNLKMGSSELTAIIRYWPVTRNCFTACCPPSKKTQSFGTRLQRPVVKVPINLAMNWGRC
jgi:hypothetical protein